MVNSPLKSASAFVSSWLLPPFIFVLIFFHPGGTTFLSGFARNNISLLTVQNLQSGNRAALHQSAAVLKNGEECWRQWLRGRVYDQLGDLDQVEQTLEATLLCSPGYIHFLRAVAPEDLHLAKLAVQWYPEYAETWFWLAGLQFADDPEQAIATYAQGLELQPQNSYAWVQIGRSLTILAPEDAWQVYLRLNFERVATDDPLLVAEVQFLMGAALANSQPERAIQLYNQGLQTKSWDGIRWYELGDLLRDSNSQAALEAYKKSCYLNDPGNHGCYPAGLVAEELGDVHSAMQYYRLSNWEGAQQRLIELEQALP